MNILNLPLLIILLLTGCSTLQKAMVAPQPIWPWNNISEQEIINNEKILKVLCSGKDSNNQITCNDNDALIAFYKASKYCRSVQNYYEAGGKYAYATKAGIGVLGTFSAIVMAPLSSGSAATAWTGMSGVANAAQSSLDEGFEKSIIAKRRAFVDKAAEEGEKKFLELAARTTDKPSNALLIAHAIQTARSCATASAKADESVLQSLASSNSLTDEDIKKLKDLLNNQKNPTTPTTPSTTTDTPP